jgi:hypothetical protein
MRCLLHRHTFRGRVPHWGMYLIDVYWYDLNFALRHHENVGKRTMMVLKLNILLLQTVLARLNDVKLFSPRPH